MLPPIVPTLTSTELDPEAKTSDQVSPSVILTWLLTHTLPSQKATPRHTHRNPRNKTESSRKRGEATKLTAFCVTYSLDISSLICILKYSLNTWVNNHGSPLKILPIDSISSVQIQVG